MVWRSDAPQGAESDKVRFDLVPYFKGECIDLGCGPRKIFPARFIEGRDSNKDALLFNIAARADTWGDCERMPRYGDGAFDTVFSSHLLEHIADYKAALAEWWRITRVGGVLILYLPHRDHYPNRGMPGANPDHQHDFAPEDIARAMHEVAWRSGHGWEQLRDEVRAGGDEYSFLQVYRKRETVACVGYDAPRRPEKSLGIVRLGAYGDALWITPLLPALKAEGWHITLYTQRQGEASLRHDPHIDAISVQPDHIFGLMDDENARLGFPSVGALQTAYHAHLETKHDRLLNLIGTVEGTLLPHMTHPLFWLPDATRRATMNRNYVETIHAAAGVPFDRGKVTIRFTPSAEERAWAEEFRQRAAPRPRAFVVINPSGSSAPKWWPHAQECMERLAKEGAAGVLVGDLKGHTFSPPVGWQVLGMDVDIRKVFALAAQADVVIGTESAVINSVAHEPPLKMVLLSHSTPEQLTRDWDRTVALQPEGLACYPCHRIHMDFRHCYQVPETGAAACQHAMSAETVAAYALQWLRGEFKEAA